MVFKRIDFTKIGFASDIKEFYEVSDTGLIRKKNIKNNTYKYIGSYTPLKSRIKYKGIEIQIKYIVAASFYPNYIHNKYDVNAKNGDLTNCSIDNLLISLKKEYVNIPVKQNIIDKFNNFLENGILKKMAYYVMKKFNFYPVGFYDYEDALQDLFTYCYFILGEYSTKKYKSFEQFLYLKMYDKIRRIIRKKARLTNYSIDYMISNDDRLDCNNLVIDCLF